LDHILPQGRFSGHLKANNLTSAQSKMISSQRKIHNLKPFIICIVFKVKKFYELIMHTSPTVYLKGNLYSGSFEDE